MRKSHVFHRLIKFVQTTMFKNMYISVCVRERKKERKREYMKLKSLRSFPELF